LPTWHVHRGLGPAPFIRNAPLPSIARRRRNGARAPLCPRELSPPPSLYDEGASEIEDVDHDEEDEETEADAEAADNEVGAGLLAEAAEAHEEWHCHVRVR
jgi:hypothetical protein